MTPATTTDKRRGHRPAHHRNSHPPDPFAFAPDVVALADSSETDPLSWVHAYAELGWCIFPISATTSKPLISAWPDVATTDPHQIEAWWGTSGEHRGAGIAMVCGARSGVVVLDPDQHEGQPDGVATLAELTDTYGPLPATWTVRSGRGEGRHYYFTLPDGTDIDTTALAPGLDLLSNGHYVVLPPTSHRITGRRYEITDYSPPAPLPGWIIAHRDRGRPEPAPTPQRPAPVGDRPGDLWAAATSWPDLIGPDGWTLHHTDRNGEEHWTRPGKTKREGTSATIGYKGSDVLKVFTTGVAWLEADRTYSKLGYLAARDFAGDHSAAAKRLVAEGWGKHKRKPAGQHNDYTHQTGENVPETPTQPATPVNLPEDFWTARPALTHIRQAAHRAAAPADAVFGSVIARIAALTPPSIMLPAPVGTEGSLNVAVARIGPPGSGKGISAKAAARLLPIDDEGVLEVALGSGEGLIEADLAEVDETGDDGKTRKVKRQVRRAVLAHLDEGQALFDMGHRKGSTLLTTIRSAWSGERLGQANASKDTTRHLNEHEYRFALVAGFQPEHAQALIDDAPGGTPQRFLWVAATDPTIPDDPPENPGPLPWSPPVHQRGPMDLDPAIAAEIRTAALQRARGEVVTNALDEHRDQSRLKVAGLLAILDGRLNITAEDWQLAGAVLDASDAVRSQVIEHARITAREKERAYTAKLANRDTNLATSREERCTKGAARAIARHVWRGTCQDGCRRRCAWPAASSEHRKHTTPEAAFHLAETEGFIITSPDGTITPGEVRP